MKITGTQVRKIVEKVIKEQVSQDAAVGAMNRQYYKQKADKLRQALALLEKIQDDEAVAPGGNVEELEGVVDELYGVLDAVEALA